MVQIARMSDPSPLFSPTSTVGRSELVVALQTTRSSLDRAIAKGTVAEPDRKTLGGQRRWSLALAARVLLDCNRKVPEAWKAALPKASKACAEAGEHEDGGALDSGTECTRCMP